MEVHVHRHEHERLPKKYSEHHHHDHSHDHSHSLEFLSPKITQLRAQINDYTRILAGAKIQLQEAYREAAQ